MRYKRSLDHLARAEKVIPLGAQTFSKSKLQFPPGAAPLYIERGKANKVWDIDGNEYIDFINGLASINLGYCDCLLYTSPSPRDKRQCRMPSSA